MLAKVLANRLKVVMESMIGPSQMAFVKGRQIIYSFVITEEIIHSWKKNGSGGLLVKLDFEKAYDSVDHNFYSKRWKGWGLAQDGGRSDFGILQMVNFVYDIRQFLNDIKFMPRAFNSCADSLAKAGSHGEGDILEWGDI
ncbi:hypothetical protein Ddye_009894 [Dipteronia dyeriana]|uniref:Reverse transcriptase domain-containing protein n=1 Tax=Dipteronia dyeriana TaxID=168575 RepID=A0AAD9XCL0_9ROSI|nr:hypothetical protein Ddye_009894 [Dipteronia dyeriana]